jgi:hypothetical protein
MAKNIPAFDNLVQGDGYVAVNTAPDTLSQGLAASTIPDLPQGQPSPVTPVLLTFDTSDAPNLNQTWNSGDKGTNWMGNPSYPTSKTGTEPVS